MGEVSDEPRDQSKTSTKTWSTMSTPHTALSPSRRNKMPRLFRAGHREDYPPEFLDTIERIDIICCSLKQLEKLGKAVRKDSNRKQKIWSKTAEALKVYADQMMTDEIAETFRRASTKFFEIGQLYLKHAEAIVVQFNPALREFNKVAAKEVQAHLKNLSKVRRNLDRTRKKAERRDDEETAAAVQAAQKDHDEYLATTKEAIIKFLQETAFFQGAANAYLAMEKELCDKIYQELNSLRDEGSKQKKQKSGDSKSGEQKPDDQKHEDQKPEEDQKQEDQKEEDHKQKDHKQKDQKKDGHKPEEKKTGSQEPEEDHKQKDQKKDGHKPEEKKTGSQEPEEDHKQKDQKKDGQKPGGQKTGSQEPEDEKNS